MKVAIPTTAIALAVGLTLWFAIGNVAVVATGSLVIGALGAGAWYRRYFKRIKERTRRGTRTGSGALALVGALSLAGAPQLYAYAEATLVEDAAATASAVAGWEKDYPGLWDTRTRCMPGVHIFWIGESVHSVGGSGRLSWGSCIVLQLLRSGG